MLSSKKIDLQRDFAAGVCLSEAQNPIPLPLTNCVLVYCTVYLLTQGRGEGVRVTREKGRGATVHKAGSRIAT